MNNPAAAPAPGVYFDIPNPVYHSWADAESQSRLSRMFDSPALYRYHRDRPWEATESMNLGSAVHALALRPQDFDGEFAVMPKIDRRTKAGKEAYTDFQFSNQGKTVIGEDVHREAAEIAAAVWANPAAARELHGATMEASIVWRDGETGILCKARPDAWHMAGANAAVLADLKTTTDLDRFPWSAHDYGYFFQAGFYRRAVAAIDGPDRLADFRFIVVETKPPYPVRVFNVSANALHLADIAARDALRALARCRDTGQWPGYDAMTPAVLDPANIKGIDECLLPTNR